MNMSRFIDTIVDIDSYEYQPFQNPPNIERAHQHRKASLIGIPKNNSYDRVCLCCYRASEKNQISLCCSQKELLFLGISIPLYFRMLTMILCFIGGMFVIKSLEKLVVGGEVCLNGCQNQQNQSALFQNFIILQDYRNLQGIIISFSIVCAIALLLFIIKRSLTKTIKEFDKQIQDISSVSIIASNLPQFYDEENLKSWILQRLDERLMIAHPTYEIQTVLNAFLKRQDLTIQLNKTIISERTPINVPQNFNSLSLRLEKSMLSSSRKNIVNQIEPLDQCLRNFNQNNLMQSSKSNGVAFLTFQTSNSKVKILQKYTPNHFFSSTHQTLQFQQKSINFHYAPSPNDIIWKNLPRIDKKHGFTNIIFLIAAISLTFLSVGSFKFTQLIETQKEGILILFKLLAVYSITNLLLHFLINLFICYRYPYSYSLKELLYQRYYSIFNCILTCSLPYCMINDKIALVNMVNFIIFINAISHPLSRLCEWKMIFKIVQTFRISRMKSTQNPYTQSYVNRVFQGNSFSMGNCHQYLLRVLVISSWFSSITILSFVWYFIGLILEYWIARYLLLRRSRAPPKISKIAAEEVISSMKLYPMLYIAGSAQFQSVLYYDMTSAYQIVVAICLLLCIVYIMNLYFQSEFQNGKFQENPKYLSDFSQLDSYEMQDPFTRYKGDIGRNYKSKMNKRFYENIPENMMASDTPKKTYGKLNKFEESSPIMRSRLFRRMLSLDPGGSFEMNQLNTSQQYKDLTG